MALSALRRTCRAGTACMPAFLSVHGSDCAALPSVERPFKGGEACWLACVCLRKDWYTTLAAPASLLSGLNNHAHLLLGSHGQVEECSHGRLHVLQQGGIRAAAAAGGGRAITQVDNGCRTTQRCGTSKGCCNSAQHSLVGQLKEAPLAGSGGDGGGDRRRRRVGACKQLLGVDQRRGVIAVGRHGPESSRLVQSGRFVGLRGAGSLRSRCVMQDERMNG